MNFIGGVEIPRITAQETSRKRIGGRLIKTHRLTAAYLTKKTQFDALGELIDEVAVDSVERAIDGTAHVNGGAAVSMRLSEWPDGVYRNVYILAQGTPDRRTPFHSGTAWESSGRTLELEVEEA